MPFYGYVINPACGILDLKKQLCKALSLASEQHRFKRYYLDSFDWRLLKKGYCLQAEQHDDAIQLQLYRLSDQRLISQATSKQLPRTPEDLPQTKLAGLLSPILGLRALMPQIELNVSQRKLLQRNRQDKITAEISIESATPIEPRRTRPIKLLRYTPTRGYDKQNRTVSRWLNRNADLQAMAEATLPWLITQLDIPAGQDRKPATSLHAEARTDYEIKQLLNYFLSAMRNNENGVIEDIDTEFLHDFRIAVRRSRTLLDQVPDIMPKRTLSSFTRQLAHLGTITTPLRDLDVMLLNFDDYRDLIAKKIRHDLDPAQAFIQQQRQLAYRQVCRYLQSKTYAGFCQRWQAFLQSPGPASTPLANAKRPLKEVADRRTWKAYRKVLKQGLAITDASPADALHALRKSCKKLRYLLEFFRSLYPAKKMKALISTLKMLQDQLGEFQDIHVHMDFFRNLRSSMQEAGQLDDSSAHAIDKVVAALDNQQQECRKVFQSRFKPFSSPEHQQLFKLLFKS